MKTTSFGKILFQEDKKKNNNGSLEEEPTSLHSYVFWEGKYSIQQTTTFQLAGRGDMSPGWENTIHKLISPFSASP